MTLRGLALCVGLALVGCKKPALAVPDAGPAPEAVRGWPHQVLTGAAARAARGDPVAYAAENEKVIAAFAQNCAFEPVVEHNPNPLDGPALVSECAAFKGFGFDKCMDAEIDCIVACSPACFDCGARCVAPCKACQEACAPDGGDCLRACAVDRQHCRHDCWDQLAACRELCKRAYAECKSKKVPPSNCPDCDGIRACLQYEPSACRKVYSEKNAPECFTRCAP